jgi:hypothetical protein
MLMRIFRHLGLFRTKLLFVAFELVSYFDQRFVLICKGFTIYHYLIFVTPSKLVGSTGYFSIQYSYECHEVSMIYA